MLVCPPWQTESSQFSRILICLVHNCVPVWGSPRHLLEMPDLDISGKAGSLHSWVPFRADPASWEPALTWLAGTRAGLDTGKEKVFRYSL